MASATHGAPDTFARDERKREVTHRAGALKDTLVGFWTKINNDWIFNLSSMLAYNFLMSAFPILLVLLAIGGFILGAVSPGSEADLTNSIGGALPGGTGQELMVNVTHNLNQSAGLLLIVGIVLALITGSGLFITLENCMGVVFKLRGRNPVHQRAMALSMLLLYAVLIPIIILATIIPATIERAIGGAANNAAGAFFFQVLGIVVSVLVAFVLFGAIYVVVPNRPVRLGEVWKGTLVAAILLVIYDCLFPIYVSAFLHPQNYGSTAGFAVVILIFFYYLGFILLLGAEVNSWAIGQRETAGSVVAILHEVQAHNTTRGAAGPTAGMPQEDLHDHKGAAAMNDMETAIRHEREDHHSDETPPKYAESGVDAPGYNIEPPSENNQVSGQEGGKSASGARMAKTPEEAQRVAAEMERERERDDDLPGGLGSGPSSADWRNSTSTNATDAQADMAGGTRARAVAAAPQRLGMPMPSSPPLTERQRRALGVTLAAGALAVAPAFIWLFGLGRGSRRLV